MIDLRANELKRDIPIARGVALALIPSLALWAFIAAVAARFMQ